MGTVTSPTSFTLNNQGDTIKTSQFLSISQGIYLQFTIPTVSLHDILNISLIGPTGLVNSLNKLTLSYTYTIHSAVTGINGLANLVISGITSVQQDTDIWSLYISNENVYPLMIFLVCILYMNKI
jgi:hypothetical protein